MSISLDTDNAETLLRVDRAFSALRVEHRKYRPGLWLQLCNPALPTGSHLARKT
jgi:hypothetical protein